MSGHDPEIEKKKKELLESELTNKELRERIELLRKMQENKSKVIGPI